MLDELAALVEKHARADYGTAIEGLSVARSTAAGHEHERTGSLLVVMARGHKQLLLGDQAHEFRTGEYIVTTTELPVVGRFVDASPENPHLGIGVALDPGIIAPLLPRLPPAPGPAGLALATGRASHDLLDAVVRLTRLLDHPGDAPVLAPLIRREIHWRLLTGPHTAMVRAIGTADSNLTHINRVIRWIRDHYAEPLRIDDAARLAGLSPSAFHRHFRAVTAMSPLQYQKRIRLQEARALLSIRADDIAGVGHLVGYDSPSQFSREYRRLFGVTPGRHAAQMRQS